MSELDPILSRAFAAGRAEKPPSNDGRDRTLEALGLRAASAGAEAGRAKRASRRVLDWRWWSLGVVALVAAGAASFHREAPAPPLSAPRPAAPRPAAPRPAEDRSTNERPIPSAAEHAPAPMLAVTELPSAAPIPPRAANMQSAPIANPPPVARRAVTSPASGCSTCPSPEPIAKPAGSSLREEVEALGLASRALSERRCGSARQALADYRARFPSGRLEREADVVDVEIIGRAGDLDKARAAARRFVARFPDSPYAMRLAPWLREAGDDRDVARCLDAAP